MTLYETITAAINDIVANGYDSVERVDGWLLRIRAAARAELMPEAELVGLVKSVLAATYARQVDAGAILKLHPDVARFTLERVRPQLRAELDRRIMASAQLIKMNREAAIEKTLQRFSGWATSIPSGGSGGVDRRETKTEIRKAMVLLPFAERRVAIDQGHKFTAALSATLALNTGAIAGRWHSHWRQRGYDYREDHKERDEQVYAVRDCWARERGLMTKGSGYTDDMTAPAEEPFCRCTYQWLYNLRDLPASMLTDKGSAELTRVREMLHAG